MLPSEPADAAAIARFGLNFRIYRPNEERSKTLVLLVHGRGGNTQVMWPLSRIVSGLNAVVLSPEAFLVDEEVGGFSWWPIPVAKEEDVTRAALAFETVKTATARLAHFITEAKAAYTTPDARVISMGFSQGGAVISACGLQRAGTFDAIALLASFVPRAVFTNESFIDQGIRNRTSPLPKFFMAHGRKDQILPLERAEESRDQLLALGANVDFSVDDVGHKVGSTSIQLATEWMAQFA